MEDAIVEYGDARIQWVVATQLVMALHGCAVVDLEAELVASGVGRE